MPEEDKKIIIHPGDKIDPPPPPPPPPAYLFAAVSVGIAAIVYALKMLVEVFGIQSL